MTLVRLNPNNYLIDRDGESLRSATSFPKDRSVEMILYSTVGTADMARAVKFYDALFGTLGIGRASNSIDGWAGWGGSYDEGYGFWVCNPFDGRSPTVGNGSMIAFRAKDEAQVRAFHAAALAHGGSDEGGPGTRPYYEPTFYVAYVRDPDGNKLACVYHKHSPVAEG